MKSFTFALITTVLCTASSAAQAPEPAYDVVIHQQQKQIVLLKDNAPLMEIDSMKFNFVSPASMTIIKQQPDTVILGMLYNDVPDIRKVNASNNYTVEVLFAKNHDGWHITANPQWARHITIYLKDLHEHFFGICENLIPDNRKAPEVRGTIQTFEVKGEDSRYFENYASAWSAFYFCSLGYASFFNTFAAGDYEFAINGVTKIYHHTGTLDWYIFTGADGDAIMSAYYKVIGAPKYIPSWACGPVVWRDENKGGKDELLDDVRRFTQLKIPLAAIFADRPYSHGVNGWSKMDFSDTFSHPEVWIPTLQKEYGLQFMTWIGPCAFGDTFPGTLPGYYSYFDLSDSSAVGEFGRRMKKEQYAYGVKGHKMDRAEEHFPEGEIWKDKTPQWEQRNKYIYLYAKVTDSILTAAWGKDNFNFSRSAMHGAQKYLSALWGGDSRASWDGMAANLANAIRSGFMGFPVWGSDVGGYLGDDGMEPEQLFSRWLQWGAWCGLFEIKLDGTGGKGNDRAPWHYGEALQNTFRKACEERMALAPYIYSQANTSAKNGILMKPLAYVYYADTMTYALWNEYLFGSSFLVAPVTEECQSQSIYLPYGTWYDWYKPAAAYQGCKTYAYTLSGDHIPVFVKENSLFVTGDSWLKGNSIVWNHRNSPSLIIHAFPGTHDFNNQFEYIDRDDHDQRKVLAISQTGNHITVTVPALSCGSTLVLYNFAKRSDVTVNGKNVKVYFDPGHHSISVALEKNNDYTILLAH